MKYKLNYDFFEHKKETILPRDTHTNWSGLFLNDGVISCNDKTFQQLLDIGIIEQVGETMITIKGKEYSESTIHEALKEYIGD